MHSRKLRTFNEPPFRRDNVNGRRRHPAWESVSVRISGAADPEITVHGRKAQKSKKPASKAGFLNLAPLTGLEPVTYGLTVRRSTD